MPLLHRHIGKHPTTTQVGLNNHGLPILPLLLSPDIEFLLKYGVTLDLLVAVELRAKVLNQPAAKVLLNNEQLTQERYFQLLARELKLDF